MSQLRFCIRTLLSVSLAVSTITASASDFVDLRRAAAFQGDAKSGEAKTAVCSACHGVGGNALVPMFPVLAGQHADYLYQALRGFQRRNDPASPMTPQARDLSDIDMRNIATYFSTVSRHAAVPANADAQLASVGERLFREGDGSKGIPPCQGCHGARAEGNPLATKSAFYRLFPSLQGQHADYIVARLAGYRDGKISDTSNARIMRGVAKNIDDESAKSVAAWLSQLAE